VKKIYISRLFLDPAKGGGCRRATQIYEILNSLGFEFQSIFTRPPINTIHPMIKFFGLLRKYPFIENYFKIIRFFKWNKIHRDQCFTTYRGSMFHACHIKSNETYKLVAVDDPVYCRPLIKKLIKVGIPFISISHNLESLASNQIREKYRHSLFHEEIQLLSNSKLVITISREESFILNNFGIKNYFLPYYPSDINLSRLKNIRKKRNTNFQNFLLLGTANNLPTMNSKKKFISKWIDHNFKNRGKLYVAGFGTEKLSEYFTSRILNVEILGTLDNDDLDQLLAKVMACICYQENGSGALTRIAELLLANVPVISNDHAARSYYNLPGIFIFSNFKEFKCILNYIEKNNTDIKIPLLKKPNHDVLLKELSNYAN